MYYALYDFDTKDYMHTGLNATSHAELKEAILSYVSHDIGDGSPQDVETFKKMSAEEMAKTLFFDIHEDTEKFPEKDFF